MKCAYILPIILAISPCVFAQEGGGAVVYQSAGPVTSIGVRAFGKGFGAPVQGAPYSATMTNENVQVLADGTRITQSSTGNVARDSEGRTRQDAALPAIGNLSAADAPHLVFIQDPVAQTAYTLNLTDKTAEKMPALPPNAQIPDSAGGGKFLMHVEGPPPMGGPQAMGMAMQKVVIADDQGKAGPEALGKATTEDLGAQTMEGIEVTGVRTTRTIPAGAIGNDRPLSIVTEVWTSPDLKTIVYSKRTDPRMGEQTFQLTNIVRVEPEASLFTVPSDFKIVEGPQNVVYRSKQ
jgi:hypothetical protein